MSKPNFGNVDRRIEWNDDRVAWVRHLVEEKGMTAREIALDIGLAANQAPRIFELCKRCNIQLSGQGGRPRQEAAGARAYRVGVQHRNSGPLARLAARHSLDPSRIAEMILNAAIETGDTFCENLLDLDTEQ
ncbi:hypothetical protein CWO91_34775 [Bradyrhizobium genosp. SA-3]|uniref:hypothetical protein n=1 Tax=Bradyrhizobium genosp. SA-3 TaxID=508868 RepID=UPI00102A1482|nr:hypothetical protein [Bradyrhizobium genosp. SA-3]RZM99939.1 hypothetical protein CWO91_34775 [Bradyrhizobium genosp. SA-3]